MRAHRRALRSHRDERAAAFRSVPRAPCGAGGRARRDARRIVGPRARRAGIRRAGQLLSADRLRAPRTAGGRPDCRRSQCAGRFSSRRARGEHRRAQPHRKGAARLPDALGVAAHPRAPASRGTLLVIDRAVEGHFLPEGQGVGLARKIGNDAVLAISAAGRIASPWLHNTDADTLLPRDYFDQIEPIDPAGVGCAVYFFDHRFEADPDLAQAGRLYEISLRYYVLGLAWAGSPYAYQSMGSCLAIPSGRLRGGKRGFPRKNAAEDFYVLDKLAKVGTIARLAGAPLSSRGAVGPRSLRHGPRAAGPHREEARRPGRFPPLPPARLRAPRRVAPDSATSRGRAEEWRSAFARIPRGNPFFRDGRLEPRCAASTLAAVAEAVAARAIPDALLRRLHTWFDAFRTLKLAHALRDSGFPSTALAGGTFRGAVHRPLRLRAGRHGHAAPRARRRRTRPLGESRR